MNAPIIDDIDRIMQVMTVAFDAKWGEAWNRRQVSDAITMPHIQYSLIDSGGNIPVLETEIAGFALTKYVAEEEELLLIAIAPNHRGKGLGTLLLQHCFNDAVERGAERMFLEMRDNNPARILYEKQGFDPVGRRSDYYEGAGNVRIDAITYAKVLL